MKHFRGLKININRSRLAYRYPFKLDNDNFIQQLSKFIEDDLTNNAYLELNEYESMFYVDLIDGKIEFVDRSRFLENERIYIKKKKIYL